MHVGSQSCNLLSQLLIVLVQLFKGRISLNFGSIQKEVPHSPTRPGQYQQGPPCMENRLELLGVKDTKIRRLRSCHISMIVILV